MSTDSDSDLNHYLRILQAHDDPVRWETPQGFDQRAAEEYFLAFAHELERMLVVSLDIETGMQIQDASFLGQIRLHGSLISEEANPDIDYAVLRVSNWGQMATVRSGSDKDVLKPAVLDHIKTLLARFGYVYIPPSVLEWPYTGHNPGVTGIRTWWIRYFDWV